MVSGFTSKYFESSYRALALLNQPCLTMAQIKQLQSHLIISGSLSDPYAAGKLIALLTTSHHADLWHAQHLFDLLPHRSTYMWNTMIRAFTERNVPFKAISLYKRMVDSGVSPNNYTFSFVLRACAELSDVLLGFLCHAQVVRLGCEGYDFVQNGLIYFP
ncbi:hypothetical protein RJ639_042262 [Escallonia herrerae]|uniref:Pentatricopeptide repeat-containing protein n=1 Tax=Escallonia herrerae TaxID=1293975 RepID=A0AA89BCE7_9ASTE|nr:hypothetical protein RJ639_042262 [Escallonia herrerae]